MNVLRPTWRFDFIEGKFLRCTKFRIVSSPQAVCAWCQDWRVETEAKALLKMLLQQRRAALTAREAVRGNIDALKAAMARIHAMKQTSKSEFF